MRVKTIVFWIFAALISWIAAFCYFHRAEAKLQPEIMAKLIEKDLHKRQQSLQRVLDNKPLCYRLLHQQLGKEDLQLLFRAPFYIRVYQGQTLLFWNANAIPLTGSTGQGQTTISTRDNNICLTRLIRDEADSNRYAEMIIPVFLHYEVSNRYLYDHFVAGNHIPPSSDISTRPIKDGIAIHTIDGTTLFYLRIHPGDIKHPAPDPLQLLLLFTAVISSFIGIHLIAFYLGRYHSPLKGSGFLVLILLGISSLNHYYGLPFHLSHTELFRPFTATGSLLFPRFEDGLLNILLSYWLLSFAMAQSATKKDFTLPLFPLWVRWLLVLLIYFAATLFCLYMLDMMHMLVINPSISYSPETFNITDKFTLLVLVTITVLTRIFLITVQLTGIYTTRLVGHTCLKYMVLAIIYLVDIFLIRKTVSPGSKPLFLQENLLYLSLFLLAVFYSYLYTRKQNRLSRISNMFTLIFQGVYWSLLSAMFFKFYMVQQEQITRVNFAEQLSTRQRINRAQQISAIAQKLQSDSTIYDFLSHKKPVLPEDLEQHFESGYEESALFDYIGAVHLYSADKKSLNTSVDNYVVRSLIAANNHKTFPHLHKKGIDYYLINIPSRLPGSAQAGYIIIEIRLQKNVTPSLYPQLLLSSSPGQNRYAPHYDYAVYKNGLLKSQSGYHNFILRINRQPSRNSFFFADINGASVLYYRGYDDQVYLIAHQNGIATGLLTIFSLLFSVYLVLIMLQTWLIQLITVTITRKKIKPIYNASLNVRIRYFIFGFLILSFFFIGSFTVIFLSSRYKADNLKMLDSQIAVIAEAISDNIDQGGPATAENFARNTNKAAFAKVIHNIGRQQKLDINIFDRNGKLTLSTGNDIYNKNILNRLMSAPAYTLMAQGQFYRLLQTEHIGDLAFTGAYMPITGHNDDILGYVNIPSFYSGKALNDQIASLLTILINIYAILLLLSSFIVYVFIRNLSDALQLLADRLKNINLKKNELIEWPYRDEIGLLVTEYNKMAVAVEKNAEFLIRDERQTAWREMAKQIAHEIKNPLTSMKLNMQYLQQAILQHHPDVPGLTRRVSVSIVEQIDNLNYIASEFSNFARMPDMHIEQLDVISTLQGILALYERKETRIELRYPREFNPLIIPSDKSQFMRIFTNIIQNAIDAVPQNRKAEVIIEVVVNLSWSNVLFTINDNGTGIDDTIADRIFEPYFTTKTTGMSMGLGLAMTKKIIELWGGEIWFESVAGRGTTFFIVLPYPSGQ